MTPIKSLQFKIQTVSDEWNSHLIKLCGKEFWRAGKTTLSTGRILKFFEILKKWKSI